MSLSKIATLLLGSVSLVAGHGYVSSIEVDGTTYGGYLVDTYYFESDPPELIAWSTNATDDGYVSPSDYESVNIICHKGSAPGALSAPVAPGGWVQMTWNTWPTDHHGPVITYMANCHGSCADVDKTTLEFFKIDAGGLIDDTDVPGTWATDELIEDSYSRNITIPSDIAPGYYVLRHEIIALHSAENLDGAQNYPQCINLEVTGSETATPSGTLGTALYKETDPGIYVDIWNTLSTYTIPGPALYTAGSTATAAAAADTTTTSAGTPAEATTAAAIVSTTAEAVPTASSAPSETSATTAISAQPTAGSDISFQPGQVKAGASVDNSATEGSSGEPATTATTSVATAASGSASSTTSGVLSGACSQEGYWYCNGGSAFQRCVNGEWDASQSVAAGTVCTAGISETITISAAATRRDAMRRHLARPKRH
ncbi:lytic polysaccharide monooxygenase auxiliary activity family 9 protein [Aspergillus fijiensis CBS 313.89]|uniref:Endoglucanase-4 n=1 Tax=Aspergillus fijiensis CBS 313.89 TaxID=1448319 RepID=A0A8G1RFM8_9EURO|nr:endoglucanase-4 precursor [Aspergillus fijiensis CBS 313.89]RAK71457.1 endoglucanase-4 precursor [Aspergillus fijiensis CBS 313.89]